MINAQCANFAEELEYYRLLINSIFNKVDVDAFKLVFPDEKKKRSQRWDGSCLWDYIVKGFDKEQLDEFKERLVESGTKYNTVNKVSSRGLTKTINARAAFFASANVRKIDHVKFLAGYVRYCDEIPYQPRGFIGHTELVNELRVYDFRRESKSGLGIDIQWLDGTTSKAKQYCKISFAPGGLRLSIPDHQDSKNLVSVDSLLRWSCHLTSFVGRYDERQELREWLDVDSELDPKIRCKLIYGRGGTGKTRLAFEFAKEINESEWNAGQIPKGISGPFRFGEKGILLIIDYPERGKRILEGFVEILKNLEMPEGSGCLRVLFLCRNASYFEEIRQEAGFLFDKPIRLAALDDEVRRWELLNTAWDALNALYFDGVCGQKSMQRDLPVEHVPFINWQGKPGMPKTPLIILALAVYLFQSEVSKKDGDVLKNLSISEIFRYLTKVEVRRIRKEVEKYNDSCGEGGGKLDYRGVVLVQALAAICDEFDKRALYSLIDEISTKVRCEIPNVTQLEQLSLFDGGRLPALEPDLLAADFLTYSLNEWAVGSEADLIFAATGVTRVVT